MKFPVIGIWKISVPKDRVMALIEKLDADSDGYISLGEVKTAAKKYAKAVKRSARFADRK